jgi:hypothetical protein
VPVEGLPGFFGSNTDKAIISVFDLELFGSNRFSSAIVDLTYYKFPGELCIDSTYKKTITIKNPFRNPISYQV